MSVVAQTRYKEDYVAAFERRKAVLVPTVRGDTQDRGGILVFNVAGSGGRSTVTRGSNGDIPPSDDSQTQVTLTFAEAHDYKRYTGFDIFRSQGDQMKLMRENSMAVIHRKQDAVIIAAAEGGSVTLGSVGTMNKTIANRITTILRNANVGEDEEMGNLYCLLSAAAWDYLTDTTSFASADYVNFDGDTPAKEGIPTLGRWKHWMGMNWTAHTGLTGHGSSACTCLAYHKDALGYATSTMGIDAVIDRNVEQDYSYRRATIYHAAVKLQNSGIVKFTHDDSGLSS